MESGTQVVQTDSEHGRINTAALGAGLAEVDLNDETSGVESATTCSTISEGGNQDMKETSDSKYQKASETSKEICDALRAIVQPSNQTVQQVEVNNIPNAPLMDDAVIANQVALDPTNQEQSSSSRATFWRSVRTYSRTAYRGTNPAKALCTIS